MIDYKLSYYLTGNISKYERFKHFRFDETMALLIGLKCLINKNKVSIFAIKYKWLQTATSNFKGSGKNLRWSSYACLSVCLLKAE